MAFKSLPIKWIKIGGSIFKVRLDSKLPKKYKEKGVHGDIDITNKEIRINPNGDVIGTVIHEVIHGVRDLLGCDKDDEQTDEKDTRSIEGAVRTIIADNLHAIAWLVDAIQKENQDGKRSGSTRRSKRTSQGK